MLTYLVKAVKEDVDSAAVRSTVYKIEEDTEEYDPPIVESGIAQVTRLFKDGRKVDVIQNKSDSALFALTRFWSTLQMCFLSGRGFCCAYPRYTSCGVGILSPSAILRDEEPHQFVKPLITKYEARGFQFQARELDLHGRRCSKHPGLCVKERRSFEDRFCYTLHYDHPSDPYKVGHPLVVSQVHKTAWRFGGWHECSWDGSERFINSHSRTFNAVTGDVELKQRYGRRD